MSRGPAGLTDRSALRVEFVAKAMGATHEVDTIHRKNCVVIFPQVVAGETNRCWAIRFTNERDRKAISKHRRQRDDDLFACGNDICGV